MRRDYFRCLLRPFLLFILIMLVTGCASNRPNIPFSGSYPKSFQKIESQNQLLAQELGKLPEIQDGISDDEKEALNQLAIIYEKYPININEAFNEMHKIGLPDYRKYCSPLQALFWLILDGENQKVEEIVQDYNLDSLLSESWKISIIPKAVIADDDVLEIARNGVVDKKVGSRGLKSSYDMNVQSFLEEADDENKQIKLDIIRQKILLDYYLDKSRFTRGARKIIKASTKETSDLNKKLRWNSFDNVADRLNAPELLNHYINNNIYYKFLIPGFHRSHSSVIKEGYGDCDDLAYFGRTVLSRAGYDVFGRIVGDERISCHIGLGVRLKDDSYLLAVNFNGVNQMSGPYKTLLELDQALGYGSYKQRGDFQFDWNSRF